MPDVTLLEGCLTQVRQRNNVVPVEIISAGLDGLNLQLLENFEISHGVIEIKIPPRNFLEPALKFLDDLKQSLSSARSESAEGTPAYELARPSNPSQSTVQYTIGAPGTGKTEWIIRESMNQARNGKRVLIATYTNGAADLIFQRIVVALGQSKRTMVLRYGFTEKSQQISDEAENNYIRNSREIRDFQTANIVITTAHRISAVSAKLDPFDLVLVDEASSMPLPLAFIVAHQSNLEVHVVGDPFQLAPISCQQDTNRDFQNGKYIYSSNIYDMGDVFHEIVSKKRGHILDSQHRLPRQIQEIALPPEYKAETSQRECSEEITSALGKGPVLYIDTSDLDARCHKSGTSRNNPVHVNVIVEVVRSLLEQDDIQAETADQELLIISPYRSQKALIRRALLETGWFQNECVQGLVTTVHQAQGVERKFVIIDTTESPAPDLDPNHAIGQLWSGKDWRTNGYRLLYVAMTRSKYQLLIVANRNYLPKKPDQNGKGVEALARLNWRLDRHAKSCSIVLPDSDSSASQSEAPQSKRSG
ncbi:MAG: AAA family ATPase [Candidatus Nanopelagicales bacterium]|nr:AAA family ATPase [Candidatus Nanopelagicales bacterium]